MGLVGQHINLILNIVLAMIMLGLGISLRKEDFKQFMNSPVNQRNNFIKKITK